MEPLSAGIMTAGNMLAGAYGGGEQYDPGKLHTRWTDPYQGQLFQQMMKRGASGAGDFGFGSLVKQGTGQLQQMMADSGIAKGSGAYTSATGGMINQAMAGDQGNRRNYMMGLLGATPKKETSDQGWERYGSYGRTDANKAINAPDQY